MLWRRADVDFPRSLEDSSVWRVHMLSHQDCDETLLSEYDRRNRVTYSSHNGTGVRQMSADDEHEHQ